MLKLLRRLLPVSKNYDGENFWTVENGKKIATPLFMVICLIALTDVIFAVDSIPAIFAITSDPFIVLTSNVFAILGLRAMYFLLAAVADKFHSAELRLGCNLCLHRHQDVLGRFLQDPGARLFGRRRRNLGSDHAT